MTFNRKLLILCFLLVILHVPLATLGDQQTLPRISPLEAAQQLADHLSGLDSLSFTFTQRTSGQLSGRARQASGTAYFAKSGEQALMRWNYHSPEKQVILSDGETLKMYFENLNQMIVAPADSLQRDVTYSFFTGQNSLENDFLIEEDHIDSGGVTPAENFRVINLIPKTPASQVKEIKLWILDATRIKRIEIRDTFDTITLLNISNIEENGLTTPEGELRDPDFFLFTPPAGTEIIRQ